MTLQLWNNISISFENCNFNVYYFAFYNCPKDNFQAKMKGLACFGVNVQLGL